MLKFKDGTFLNYVEKTNILGQFGAGVNEVDDLLRSIQGLEDEDKLHSILGGIEDEETDCIDKTLAGMVLGKCFLATLSS